MISNEQMRVLLGPINTRFVKRDPGGHSYLEQHQVRAQLTRIFGFGGWSLRQLHDPRLLFEITEGVTVGKEKKPGVRIGYLSSVAIVIHGNDRDVEYQGVATGVATMGVNAIGDAHDSALKTSDSGALKRAAMCLGDQFGLGLYDDGNTTAFVHKVWSSTDNAFVSVKDLVEPATPEPEFDVDPGDLADGPSDHPEQESLLDNQKEE